MLEETPRTKRPSARAAVFLFSLALALLFLAKDSSARIASMRTLYSLTVADKPLPPVDAQSTSGYQNGQHRLILPAGATDGYHWIMQTERMLAGDGLRIRESGTDNAPAGRAVHWSSATRWWLASVAWLYQKSNPGLTMPQALERVAPWAMTAAFALFILALAPLMYLRFGALAGAVFALGSVLVYPVYETGLIGSLDHHSLAAMAAFSSVVLLLAGGAGWVRIDGAESNDLGPKWLPELSSARLWFGASAFAAGAGLWISASTMAPVMAGIGAGALVAILPFRSSNSSSARIEPSLWRLWGAAGCATSLGFYLLEYFPAHFGFRLEVNHPLFALAWLALGDLLCRLMQSESHTQRRWLLADLLVIAVVPAAMLLAQDTTFRIADPFLWALHSDYIVEFQSLRRQLATLNPWLIVSGTSLLPLILLPVAALLWSNTLSARFKPAWQVLPGITAAIGILFLHTILFPTMHALVAGHQSDAGAVLAHVICLVIDAIALAGLVVWPARHAPAWRPATQSLLMLALVPALLLLALALGQVRWLSIACVLLLAVLVVATSVLDATHANTALRVPRRIMGALVVLTLIAAPLFAALLPWRLGFPVLPDVPQVVARDVAHLLRARTPEQPAVILSGPTSTTWLTWFGGFRGLGTLYWENIEGLKSAAQIYAARTPEEARALIAQHGVTHIVVFSWEPFINEYTRLARGQRLDRSNPNRAPRDAFLRQLIDGDVQPAWLRRVPYQLPAIEALRGASVSIFEVT